MLDCFVPDDIAIKPSVLSSTGWGATTAILLSCKFLSKIATRCLYRTTVRFQNSSTIPPLLEYENIDFEIGRAAWTEFLASSVQKTLPKLKKLEITIITCWESSTTGSSMDHETFKELCCTICNITTYVDEVIVNIRGIWEPL